MKLLVVHNLASGYGEGAIYDFMRTVMRDGDDLTLRTTDGTTDIAHLIEDAADYDLVVASGGDGTVAAVCHGLVGTHVPVMPFPSGTSNLLAINLASPVEVPALAALAREGATLDFDMGEIEVRGKRFGFGIIAGCGYDAQIMDHARPWKKLLGPFAYFQAAIGNPLPQLSRFEIEVDGETYEREGVGVLVVNFSKLQFDLSVTHENLPRDGALDVVVLKAKNALELIPAIIAAGLDRDGEYPSRSDSIEIITGREIRVDADPPLQVQYDGEATGLSTPFTARVIDRAMRLVVGESALEAFDREGSATPAKTAKAAEEVNQREGGSRAGEADGTVKADETKRAGRAEDAGDAADAGGPAE